MNKIFSLLKLILILILAPVIIFAGYEIWDYRTNTRDLVEISSPESHLVQPEYDSIRVFVIGDTGSGTKAQRDVAVQMERRCRKKKPVAILHTGDMFYPAGVASIDDEQWDKKVFNMYSGDCLSDIPIFPVLGNHDYFGDTTSWIDMNDMNPRWNFPSRHYSIEYPGLVTFYALDTNYPVQIRDHGIPNFLEANTPWNIAIGHHPLASLGATGEGRSGFGIRGWLLDKFLCNKVDGYLAGHTHILKYKNLKDCNMVHLISGAGGGDLYPVNPDADAELSLSEYGYLELEFSPEEMKIRFYATSDKYVFSYKKPKTK